MATPCEVREAPHTFSSPLYLSSTLCRIADTLALSSRTMETRPGQVGTSIVVASLGLVGGLWCLSRTDLFGTFITSTLGALRRGGRRGTIEEEEEEGEERKRYVVRKEFYSSEKEDWKAVEERDDEDEDGKDPK